MKVKNISYPHPVLGNEDDVEGGFNVKFSHKLSRDSILLRYKFDLANKSLRDLIKKNKAFYSVEVECPGTFLRSPHTTSRDEGSVKLGADRLRGHVVAKFYVRAAGQIDDYKLDGLNPDYSGFSIAVSPGSVLAIGGSVSFSADKDYDPMRPSVRSLMEVKEGNHQSGPMHVEFDSPDKIVIRLSKEDFRRYKMIKSMKWAAPVLHSSIVLPVLSEAIRLVEAEDDDVAGSHWYHRLEDILHRKNLDQNDHLLSAQSILQSPLGRSLASLEDLTELDDSSEED